MFQKCPLVLSSWTLGDRCCFEDRVRAAKRAGFDGIGLRAENYADALAAGLHDTDMMHILSRYEMRVMEVEYITGWAEGHRSYEQKYKEQICFHMCQLFGVGHVNCGLMESYPLPHTAQKLRELCQRAGKYMIGVEPMPYSGIPNVAAAWALVQAAGCGNAGLLLDSWHWIRAGQDFSPSLLAHIPPERIIAIQLNDVQRRPYAPAVLRDESMHDRLLPGAGYGNTAGFAAMIAHRGVIPRVVTAEVISDALLSGGVDAAARDAYQALRRVLA